MTKDRKAVFLDMQGTLGGTGVDDITNFEFYPFSIEALRLLNENGILAIVITNQSNISRGIISQKDFEDKMDVLNKELAEKGVYFDDVYCCPHTREDKCTCKKPLVGLIEAAVKKHDVDIKESFVIGDMGNSDIVLARNAGAKGILVLTGVGKASLTSFRHTWEGYDADFVADDVLEAVKWILSSASIK
ncbi:HAD-IIIA family hydrolase [Clostridium sp. YIM B02505]|uniref:D,D-heptose 1,7-bisphosphate phosphatase n=1 Tax=Clostridium yunnanense TaxID=2800325 RepID=A0ABS1EKV6_9CLOT|nr:HAD-IIIA family hydrolase [Clostridium yunnanense]MBK1810006.1 HAD-IIIA family hydrolase [Clostridium yunnanense]